IRWRLPDAAWRLLNACLPVSRLLIPGAARRSLARLLRNADVDEGRWLPEHIITLQWLLFLVMAFLVAGIARFGLQASLSASAAAIFAAFAAAIWLPLRKLKGMARRRQSLILRDLPFMLDMITLCVEAGQNLHGALQQAARHGPAGPLRNELLLAL